MFCKKCKKKPVLVNVKIPADLSCDGKEKKKNAQVDACISSLVSALQKGGIDMRGSCCGHGEGLGEIHLQDGRMLLIVSSAEEGWKIRDKYLNNMEK
ncbi:hypothetical protein H8D91_02030 [archaeon]|nr:hypothetical protein [archaeon]